MFLALDPLINPSCQNSDPKKSRKAGFFMFKNHTERDARDMPYRLCKGFDQIIQNGIIYAHVKKLILEGFNYEEIFITYFSDFFTIL